MDWTWILVGCAGGALPDAIRLAKGRHEVELPAYLKSANFYLGFVVLVALGGAAAWLGEAKDVKTALAFGFAAPEIISRLLSSPNPATMADGGRLTTVRRWWAF